MRVNGTLMNYYFHCKRQCYLHGNRLNLEDNSEEKHFMKKKRRMKIRKFSWKIFAWTD